MLTWCNHMATKRVMTTRGNTGPVIRPLIILIATHKHENMDSTGPCKVSALMKQCAEIRLLNQYFLNFSIFGSTEDTIQVHYTKPGVLPYVASMFVPAGSRIGQ